MTSKPKTKPSRPRAKIGVTTTDDFLGGRLSIVQPKTGHRAGSDAVFLAAAVDAQAGEAVLDAGAGVGVAGLWPPGAGPEDHRDRGRARCAAMRACGGGIRSGTACRTGSPQSRQISRRPPGTWPAAGLIREGYGQVMANPPFYVEGAVRIAPDAARAAAHVMPRGELGRWVRFLTTMGRAEGHFDRDPPGRLSRRAPGFSSGPVWRPCRLSAFPQGRGACGPRHRAGAQRQPRRLAASRRPGPAWTGWSLHGGSRSRAQGRGGAFSWRPRKKGPPPRGDRRQPQFARAVRRALGPARSAGRRPWRLSRAI